MTSVDPQTLGQTLRKAREHLGLSINDVSMATKINPRILKALEDGQHELLPAKSFTRGFIRTYANYLKLDPKPLLDAYEGGETKETRPASQEAEAPKADEKKVIRERPSSAENNSTQAKKPTGTFAESRSTPKVLLVSAILLLVVMIIGIKKVVDKYAHERAVDNTAVVVTSPVMPTPTPTDSTLPGALASPAPSPTDSAALAASEDTTDEDDAADAKTPAISPSTTPSAKPSVKATPTPSATPSPTQTTKPNLAESKDADKPAVGDKNTANKNQEVIIEALDTVDVTIQADGEAAKTVKLTPESIHTIKAKTQIDLEISDGGMVNIIYNGHERGVPGVLGKPVKIKFPQ